jgi:hypothetical protein
LNKKPLENVLFALQDNLTDRLRQMMHGQIIGINGMLDHAVMTAGTNGDKRWIVDIDTLDENIINLIEKDINNARSTYSQNVIARIPTAHGVHIVTHPFNIVNTSIGRDIKREGLTLLYAYLEEN